MEDSEFLNFLVKPEEKVGGKAASKEVKLRKRKAKNVQSPFFKNLEVEDPEEDEEKNNELNAVMRKKLKVHSKHFTSEESARLKKAGQQWLEDRYPILEDAIDSCFGPTATTVPDYVAIAQMASVEGRTYNTIKAKVTALFSTKRKKGKFTREEENTLANYYSINGSAKHKEIAHMLNRSPQSCKDKWRELRPLIQTIGLVDTLRRQKGKIRGLTERDKAKLLKYIYQTTGTRLPWADIPWKQITLRFKGKYSEAILRFWYTRVVFQQVMEEEGGASVNTVIREVLRYLKPLVDSGKIKIVHHLHFAEALPWWPLGDYSCNDLKTEVDIMYSTLECEKKQKKDKKRLARSVEILKKLNGSSVVQQPDGTIIEIPLCTNPSLAISRVTGEDEEDQKKKDKKEAAKRKKKITETANLVKVVKQEKE
eukprot:GHVP01000272.1.p1 GENE.GHVP01000272.1~~GHVP01000272.1.p1  ORF type:complete len:424 (+),score=98.50 GHVP01000272.1:1252-2523(+)